MKALLLVIVMSLVTTLTAHAGTARYDDKTNTLYMEGGTNLQLKIETMINVAKYGEEIEEVVMWGGGGSAAQMIPLMKIIKDLGVPVSIPKGKSCASACALVAVASDTVIVRGKLLFHFGYISAYPKHVSLQEILNYGQIMSLSISRDLYNIGFKFDFIQNLATYTGPNMWYVVTSSRQLDDCRMKGNTVEEYMKPCFIKAPLKETQNINFYGE